MDLGIAAERDFSPLQKRGLVLRRHTLVLKVIGSKQKCPSKVLTFLSHPSYHLVGAVVTAAELGHSSSVGFWTHPPVLSVH